MRKALGRGLDALIPAPPPTAPDRGAQGPLLVPIERVRPNHLQPRRVFDPEKLAELAGSIREHGLAQPILVSHDRGSDTYELIAGERRLRACELAGLKDIPVVVREPSTERERLALALVENIQREDLNPIEEALGYLRLMRENKITQTDLGGALGKSKAAISNTLRLLELPEEMQRAVEYGQLSEGHARALLMVDDPLRRKEIFELALSQKLSVRQLEDVARVASSADRPRKAGRPRKEKAADISSLETELQHSLGTKVEILTGKKPTTGRVVIHFFSLEEFDSIINMLKK